MKQLRPMTLRRVNLRPFWRTLPDWFGPAAYGVTVFAIIVSAMAILMTIGGSPGPHTVTQQVENKRVAARAPMDTPDTAPQLSPIYPTTAYNIPESTGQAELARKLARDGKPQAFTVPPEETREGETLGYSPRYRRPQFRPDIPQ